MTLGRNMLRSAALLAVFAIIGTTLVALTFDNTRERVIQNKRDFTLARLHELIAAGEHDNDIDRDIIQVTDPRLGTIAPVIVYRARKQGEPVAAIIQSIAPDGYSGTIEMLIAMRFDGSLAGVRVVDHKETPGLGDAIDARKSDWINQFRGLSQDNTAANNWKVKRDGGKFDQITSATITSRAVVKAVYNTLSYFNDNREALFSQDTP